MLNVLHYVTKMDRAGQETFIMNLFRKIDGSQIQFDFLCSDRSRGDFDDEIHALGGNIFYLPPVTMSGPLKQVQKFFSMVKTLKTHPCDIFHIHTYHAMDAFRDALAAKLCGIRTVIVHSHNTNTPHHLRAHQLFKKMLRLLPIQRLACSQAAGHWMFGNAHFRMIPNALELDTLYYRETLRDAVRAELDWQDQKIIGHVGRFQQQKNHHFLIEIFAAIHQQDPTTKLVLVGKGELQEQILQLVQEKGLQNAVCFMGTRADVARLYQGMDLLLFPSLFEGLSVVLLEAQACDLPCLISDTNSAEVVLTDRITMESLQTPADVWAQTALQLLSDTRCRQDNRHLIRSSGYDMEQLAHSMKDLYLGH